MTNRKELDRDFFKGKRPWSKIKDEVLRKYMKPYLAKVNKLGKNILLIDTFAGPGVYEDGTIGSPLLMVQKAQKMVPDNYQAIFVNNNKLHHDSISHLFGEKSPLGNLIKQKKVIPVYGDAKKLLDTITEILGDQTVFLYLDPYDLEGTEFKKWLPFLKRVEKSSTEILINIHIPIILRLSSRKAIFKGIENRYILQFHKKLDKVFGGDYWKSALLDPKYSTREAEEQLMKLFKENLQKHIKYVGYCPVREHRESHTKYYMLFLSNSTDGLLLMNDLMCIAYNRRMVESDYENLPLFKGVAIDWKENRKNDQLKKIILKLVKDDPKLSRIKYWNQICVMFFMHYTSTEYRNSVKELCNEGSLLFENVSGGNKLNNACILSIP